MYPSLPTEAIPLITDEAGVMRVSGTRIPLEILAAAWQAGETPEQIVDQHPALKLADVYAVIAWMLRHPAVVKVYLARGGAETAELRRHSPAQASSRAPSGALPVRTLTGAHRPA